jgi:hypothetical protein
MGFFAALMTYLVAAALLIGGAVAGLSVLFAPSEMLTPRSAPPLVRAAERKAPAPKPEPAPQPKAAAAAPPAEPASAPATPAVNPAPAVPAQSNNATRAGEQTAAQPAKPARKKKIVKKPAPLREADTTTLGYGPSEFQQRYAPSEPQRRFIFPLDPGW